MNPFMGSGSAKGMTLILPLWIPAAVLLVFLVWFFWKTLPYRRLKCVECGYCLFGNRSGQCPECNSSIPKDIRVRISELEQ